jgi:hypothetical protein
LDLENIKESLDTNLFKEINKNVEKNKIITDIYKIKIDIENPNDSKNTNKDDSKEVSIKSKSDKKIEIIPKEDDNVNKENIQNNGQNSAKKSDNDFNNKDSKIFVEKNDIKGNLLIKTDKIIDINLIEDFDKTKNDSKNKEIQNEDKNDNIEENTNNKKGKNFEEIHMNIKDIDIKNDIKQFKPSKSNEHENNRKIKEENEFDKDNKIVVTLNKYLNSKSNDDKNAKNNKDLSKLELKPKKPINKIIRNIKLNNEQELNHKKKLSKIKNSKEINNSEEKLKKKQKEMSISQNKILKKEKPNERNLVKNKKKLQKKLFSPINKIIKQNSNLESKERHAFNTLESNEKLTAKKSKNKFEMNEKRIKVKKNLQLNYDIPPMTKLYKTEFSFRTPNQSLLSKDNKVDRKKPNSKSKIISFDKMKSGNKIINRKKKIDNILNYSSKIVKVNEKIKRSKNIGLNVNLKRIKETNEGINHKNDLRNLFLESKDSNNIRKEKNKNNDSISSWESDLGDVGEIIEDEAESEFGNELNELNENNFINNPKSINTYSSNILMSNNEKKRMSLSVNKNDKNSNFHISFSSNYKQNITQIKNEKINYKFKDSQEIHNKIKKKENDIEKVKKLIEIVKRNIKYYDKEIIELEKSIQNQEQIRNEYQILINYLNLK